MNILLNLNAGISHYIYVRSKCYFYVYIVDEEPFDENLASAIGFLDLCCPIALFSDGPMRRN